MIQKMQSKRSARILLQLTVSALSAWLAGASAYAGGTLASVNCALCPGQTMATSPLSPTIQNTANGAINAASILGAFSTPLETMGSHRYNGPSAGLKTFVIPSLASQSEYTPQANWDPFSGAPLPGSLNATSEQQFNANFTTPYYNGVTFQDVPGAPWNQFLDPSTAENMYALGELISNPGWSLSSYGFTTAGGWQ